MEKYLTTKKTSHKKKTWQNPRSLKNRTRLEQDISDNLWKTTQIAISFSMMTGLPKDELESVARSCLMKSALSYKEDAPANFSTWVNRCLYLHMLNYLRDNSRLLKIPRRYTEIYLKVRRKSQENPNTPLKAIAKTLDLELSEIEEVFQCFQTKMTDINYFAEEVIGENPEGEIPDNLLGKQINLEEANLPQTPSIRESKDVEADKLFDSDSAEYYSFDAIKNLTQEELHFLHIVVIKGLCDNTLLRHFKEPVDVLLDKADQLLERIYNNC